MEKVREQKSVAMGFTKRMPVHLSRVCLRRKHVDSTATETFFKVGPPWVFTMLQDPRPIQVMRHLSSCIIIWLLLG